MIGFILAMTNDPGSKAKITEIYNAYESIMFTKAFKVLNDMSLAEEAVQESFLNILKYLNDVPYPLGNKTAAYVVTIAEHCAYDIQKRENRSLTVPYEDMTEEDTELPDISIVFSETGLHTVLEIIQNMDHIYYEVIFLKYVYGYRHSEIAEKLEISEKSVQMRIYRARRILKEKLRENGYDIQ